MTSQSLMIIVQNGMNDVIRDAYNNVIKRLDENSLLTDDIKSIITSMINTIQTNKKIHKLSKKSKRISGYHIYMREHRKIVKEEHPNITPQEMTSVLAKAWKDVPVEQKQDYNERAKKESSSDNEDDSVLLATEDTSTHVDNTITNKDTSKSKKKIEPVSKKEKSKKTKNVNTTNSVDKKTSKNTKKDVKKDSDTKDIPDTSQQTETDLSDCLAYEENIESDSDLDI
jgi:hypothetical protein